MRRLLVLIRFLAWISIFAWPVGWLFGWWIWPPAPRSGWQIPENERALGFLSDNEHILTEGRIPEKDGTRSTAVMSVWNLTTGRADARYDCDAPARWRYLVHHRFVIGQKKLPGRTVTYFVSWPHDLVQLQILNAWTGEVLFRDEPVHQHHWSFCIAHKIAAYVRESDTAVPEVVWRDLSSGKVLQTFPGLAGPIDFSPNGSRFLATRWNPDDRLANLVQMEVPSGVILRSIQLATERNSRFSAQQSCNDDHLFEWTRGVIDWRTGQPIYSAGRSWFLSNLSRDGRFLVERKDDGDVHFLRWIDLHKAQLDPKKTVIIAKGESRGGGLGRFALQDSTWISATSTAQPYWPLIEKVPWLKQWLPKEERLHFVLVDGNTGQVIAQGKDRSPSFHSRDGRLLIMHESGSDRDLIWSVPLDAGLHLWLAVAIGMSLPILVLWRKYRRGHKARLAISNEVTSEVQKS